MTSLSVNILVAAMLIGMSGGPALAQAQHPVDGKASVRQTSRTQPNKADVAASTSKKTRHEAACRSRYKSYEAKSDRYLNRGKKVRCTL